MGDALTRVYRKGVLEAEGFAVADVSEYLEQPDTVVWVDFCGPSKEQLHELAGRARPARARRRGRPRPSPAPEARPLRHAPVPVLPRRARRRRGRAALDETEIDAFINERWLITVRKNDGFSIDPVLQRWDRSPDLAGHGVSFLLYGLLDVVVDGYFDAIQAFDDYYDEVSDGIFADHPLDPAQQRHWFEMRRAMVRFHRLVVPMREAISSLMRREHSAVAEELYPYFQDVYDHILRSASPPIRSATSSARSSRPTSACATTARTRS